MKQLASIFSILLFSISLLQAQPEFWRKGILIDEFLYEKASFPACHSATVAETTAGTMVATFFGGTYERHPDVSIYVCRRIDGKWTSPVEVANGVQPDGSRLPSWNPVIYQVPDGELQLYYKIGPNPREWQGWLITSTDDGVSWSEPRMLPEGHVGPVKNKPVLIGNRLFCPSSLEPEGWKVHFEVTEDFGKTWEFVGPINDGKTIHAIQPSLLYYPDGRLQVLCRSRNRAIMESWSDDGGKTWSEMKPTELPNNNSGTDAVTLADGRQVLVYNHVLPPADLARGIRTPLNVAVSENGKDWYASLILESSPLPEYSYPSVIQTKDGLVHFIYTWRRERIKYVVVDPSELQMVKIENGQWPDAVRE